MNIRNLGHWAVLGVVILGIGGVIYGMHEIDQQDQNEVTTSNHQHAQQTRHSLLKNAAASKSQRDLSKTAFDRVNKGKAQPKFSKHFTQELKNKKFVGSALVVKNDRVLYQRAFGYANAKKKQKNKVTSQFLINSVQKSMTGLLVMKAVQAGQLQLTDRLSQYYPGIKGSNRVTIRQMLNMEAGITGELAPGRTLTEDEAYQYAGQTARISPGKIGQFDYQQICFTLLAGILHQVTHDSYYELFYQQMVTPLNLNHTGFAQLRATTKGMTTGYAGTIPRDYTAPHKPSAASMAIQVATGNATMSTGDVFRAEQAIVRGSLLSTPAGAQVLHEANANIHYTGGLYHLGQLGYYGHGMGDDYESTVAISKDGQTGVILLSNNFVKKTMYPDWSTEDLGINTFRQIMRVDQIK